MPTEKRAPDSMCVLLVLLRKSSIILHLKRFQGFLIALAFEIPFSCPSHFILLLFPFKKKILLNKNMKIVKIFQP